MIDFYIHRQSPVHRFPAGAKLLFLAFAGAGLFFVDTWPAHILSLSAALALAALARLPARALAAQLRPLLFFIAIIFAAQLFFNTLESALVATLRLLALLILAIVVTLSTRPSDMIAAIERGLSPLKRWIAVEKVSLAISLALRFIPVLGRLAQATREAQWARGQDRNILALATPLIVSTLKAADQIAEALDARGFGAAEGEARDDR